MSFEKDRMGPLNAVVRLQDGRATPLRTLILPVVLRVALNFINPNPLYSYSRYAACKTPLSLAGGCGGNGGVKLQLGLEDINPNTAGPALVKRHFYGLLRTGTME